MSTYAPLASPTLSEEIPLVDRSHPMRDPHSPVSPRTGTLPAHFRPSLKLDTSYNHNNKSRKTTTTSPQPPSTPPPLPSTSTLSNSAKHRIPLPTNEHSAALASLRSRVDEIHGQTALVASPTHSNFSGHTTAGQSETDVFFAHLAKIRTLGAEVGALHSNMQGVGVGWAGPRPESTQVSPAMPSTVDDKEKRKEDPTSAPSTTTKEFDDTAAMFERRQASIEAIMGKLATLSTSLSAFHNLPTPTLGFNPRRSTTAGRTMTPSPPPSASPFAPSPKTSAGPSSSMPHKRSNLRAGETFADGLRREAAREREDKGLGLGI